MNTNMNTKTRLSGTGHARSRLSAALWVAGVLLLAIGWSAPAQAVTVDGAVGSGEWDAAPVVLLDPDEATPSENFDVSRIRLDGGNRLYLAVETRGGRFQAPTAGQTDPYFSYYFSMDQGGTVSRYGLTLGGHNLDDGQMHLLGYDSGWEDLAIVTWAADSALEAAVEWEQFGLSGPPGEIQLDDHFFLYNVLPGDADASGRVSIGDAVTLVTHFGQFNTGWAGGDFDLNGRTSIGDAVTLVNNFGRTNDVGWDLFDGTVEVNGPLAHHTPEPLTLVGLLAGGAAVWGYVRRRRS